MLCRFNIFISLYKSGAQDDIPPCKCLCSWNPTQKQTPNPKVYLPWCWFRTPQHSLNIELCNMYT
ncbi:hypothetical protein HanIR_Chr15g0768721 [Helianthus annuus]|nr:hypothetical protein HanIR_Chr15g0768721 [Helianthus annuus]